MKKRILIFIMVGAMAMTFIGCKKKEEPIVSDITSGEVTDADSSSVTGLGFDYEMYSGNQFRLKADVKEMSENGAKVTIMKSVGPSNYMGHKKEGEFKLDKEQVQKLNEILGRYDLKAWSELPLAGSGVSPSRSLIVFGGDKVLYNINWNTKFPKTLPPEDDIMYFELFNFFNDIISDEEGWEEVKSDNLDDPRENPAYYERKVTWFGNEVKLVPGTGRYYEDGRYADIDYEGKKWWIEEGFVGTWTLDEEKKPDEMSPLYSEVLLTVNEDGTAILKVESEEWHGEVSQKRRYKDDLGISFKEGYEYRPCTVRMLREESYENIRLLCYPGPVPEPQFTPIDAYLTKQS